MGAMKEHDALRIAAEAASKSLAALEKERAELVRKLESITESIGLLQNVAAAWARIDPQASAQQPLLAEPNIFTEYEKAARGEITDKVHEIMSDRRPRTAAAVQAEIKRRYNLDPSINAVSVALRRGVVKKKYEKQARGEYAAL